MFIKSLRLKGILSFRDTELELRPLNVLIGPNGSGKSNLIEVIGLLRALPHEEGLRNLTSEGAGVEEWVWAGEAPPSNVAFIGGFFEPLKSGESLQYGLAFSEPRGIVLERLEHIDSGPKATGTFDRDEQLDFARNNPYITLLSTHSDKYPDFQLTACPLSGALKSIRIYRELGLGPSMASKRVQAPDQPDYFLEEDGSNLVLILNRMELDGSREQVEEHLKRFYEPFQRSSIQGHSEGSLLAIKERGLSEWTYANRLSDGTVRYLCLLAILCHPNPPPLICIEEPEIGLHPDILHDVALLLLEASERTQLIVTTHSDILINALSGDPETVVVCERDFDAGTTFRRLSAKKLNLWLEDFKLGEIWRSGEIGGVRW